MVAKQSNNANVTIVKELNSGPDVFFNSKKFQKLPFDKAAEIFLTFKQTRVKPGTMLWYNIAFRYLVSHFGKLYLYDFTIPVIEEYQKLRLEGKIQPPALPRKSKRGRIATHKAGAELVNHECNALAQVLHKADVWDRLKPWYSPVPQQGKRRPKTMTMVAEQEFLRTAESNPSWFLAYLVAVITNNTGASGIELRSLRLMDVDLQGFPPKFVVNKGKNRFREGRPVPLNETAYVAMSKVIERALALGASKPDHYLFPFRVAVNKYDLTMHASLSWIKKQWKALTTAAGVPWLTPHCLRFQCATRMRAAGVPAETIRKEFGWKDLEMLEIYNQPQIDILYEWVVRIDSSSKKQPQRQDIVPQWLPKTGSRFPHGNHSSH